MRVLDVRIAAGTFISWGRDAIVTLESTARFNKLPKMRG